MAENAGRIPMAYTRYSRDCDWYVFWTGSDVTGPEGERLAVWHAEHRTRRPEFSYSAIKDMVRRSDFTAVPGRQARDDGLLRAVFTEFLQDVERKWG